MRRVARSLARSSVAFPRVSRSTRARGRARAGACGKSSRAPAPWLLVGEPDGGRLGLVVDRIHHAVLAIRAEIPLAVLRDTIAQFPTCSESYVIALRTLPGKASGAL